MPKSRARGQQLLGTGTVVGGSSKRGRVSFTPPPLTNTYVFSYLVVLVLSQVQPNGGSSHTSFLVLGFGALFP